MEYEINNNTLYISSSGRKCLVYEFDRNFEIDCSSKKLLDNNCILNGSSLSGRQIASKSYLKTNSKLPIIISESKEIIFFPTTSSRDSNCIWISYNNLKSYKKAGNYCELSFKNGEKIIVNASFFVINNQYLKSSMLNLILKKLKEEKN